jgi:hypothetical protein
MLSIPAATTSPAPPIAEPAPAAAGRHRIRRGAVGVLVVLTTVAMFASIVAVWSARQVLNTDVFVDRVDSVLAEPAVQAGMSQYITNQVMDVLNAEELASQYLPPIAQPLVGPLTAAIRSFVEDQTSALIASDTFQDFASRAVRRTHSAAVTLLEGGTVAGFELVGDQVQLNALPIIQRVLDRVNEAGLFGGRLQLPPVADEAGNPSAQIQQLADALGRPLPPDFGQIPVFTSATLEEAQRAVELVRRGIVLLLIVTVILLAVTLLLSVNRWRTLAQLGVGLAVAMLAMVFVARYVDRRVGEIIVNPDAVPAAQAIAAVFTDSLSSVAIALLAGGIVVALLGFLFGRSDSATRLRAAAGRSASRAGAMVGKGSPARGFAVTHASGLRIVALVAGALVLVWSGFSLSGAVVALVVVAVLLVATAVFVRGAAASGKAVA